MSLFASALTSLRLTFRWSNSVQTWHERTGDLVLLGGLGGCCTLLLLSFLNVLDWTWWVLLLLCGACLVPALVFSRLGWLKVFGPVLYYDVIRQARRSRFIVLRLLYLTLLVFLLFGVANEGLLRFRDTSGNEAARIAESYFNVFMMAQLVTVVALTPAYVAGAIADEKERKTLEFMLATDLLNREIVLSKLGSRLANLAMIVLTGLPILSILQFLGGIDPNLLLAVFAVTAMTVFGQAGFAILCSTVCKRPREAISLAYLGVVMYYVLWAVSISMVKSSLGELPLWFGDDPPIVADAIAVFASGSIFTFIDQVQSAAWRSGLAATLPGVVRDYALFHGLLGLSCTALAIARVRPAGLAQTPVKSTKALGFRLWPRPPISTNPMLWKELHCESGRSSWLARTIMLVLLACTFLPAAYIVLQERSYYDGLSGAMNVWVRTCNVIVGCLTILGVAVRTSNCITSERDKDTFDTLLTTPLDSSSILHAKWMGSLLGARLGMIWMGLIWGLGLITGGMHVIALPLVLVAWVVYAAFAATLGCWFSMVCKSSLRASVQTILWCFGLSAGHWLVWVCCCPVFMYSSSGDSAHHLFTAQAGLLTPPFVLGFLPFFAEDLRFSMYTDGWWSEACAACLAGLVVWTIASAVLYSSASMRFRTLTNRDSLMHAERPAFAARSARRGPRPVRRDELGDDNNDSYDSRDL